MKGFEHPETTKIWDELYYREPYAIRYYDQAFRRTLQFLQARPGDTLLDAGCGGGVYAIRAALFGCRVDAIDISSAALENARSQALAA
jgi:cyclopropane fatty-acyl-phospholipid synthase-like methyltransferase